MTPEQIEVLRLSIEQAAEPGVVSILTMAAALISALAAATLAICAIIALIYAKGQLDAIVAANQEATQTERARFLFNIDEMFENVHFSMSRAEFLREWEDIRRDVEQRHPQKSLAERQVLQCGEYSERLFGYRKHNTRKYARLMKLCGFFETLEIFIQESYLTQERVIDLYGPAIMRVSAACEAHIIKLREEDPNIDRRYLENFTNLAGRVRSDNAKNQGD